MLGNSLLNPRDYVSSASAPSVQKKFYHVCVNFSKEIIAIIII